MLSMHNGRPTGNAYETRGLSQVSAATSTAWPPSPAKNKKGISGNGPCRASPRDPPPPENRFPPKTIIRPPWRRIPMQTLCGPILSRDSPDSVISGPGPLMPEKKDLSPSQDYYTMLSGTKQT